ncbi:hypothetical protein HDF26_003811 [Pedobacter cryoconitis]|uniref:hypothetical protein n=1 Tax=Pedobacter cryoconitis TaxID=188932 RepID=UPI00161AF163|nr:hypothetical protein [Pedobacter cryoconitis]MBB6273351.1 hypothetical protein [Pedobacter cryoconitis]
MWNKLDFKKKQVLLIVFAVFLLYIAYQFSFKNAFEAMHLNSQLQKDHRSEPGQTVSYPQIERKDQFCAAIIKRYKVRKEDRENYLWQSLSGMAMANHVEISFAQGNVLPADTSVLSKGTVVNQFSFKGPYVNIVRLLDTVSKSNGIGKISMLKLESPKKEGKKENSNKLTLILGLKGIEG